VQLIVSDVDRHHRPRPVLQQRRREAAGRSANVHRRRAGDDIAEIELAQRRLQLARPAGQSLLRLRVVAAVLRVPAVRHQGRHSNPDRPII